MSATAHTPGPWWTDAEYSEEEFGCAIIAANSDCGPPPGNPTRGMVAWASDLLPENAAICEANARLIAAAPELLSEGQTALCWLRAALDCKDWHWDADQREAAEQTHASLAAAIAKATGESHG